MIYELIPESLQHNPNWVYFYRAADYIWSTNVLNKIPDISKPLDVFTEGASREDILLRASRIGWTFADNFSANWEDDDRAKRFLQRFIESWIPYCRNHAGITQALADYMGYLLGMEIRIIQLWSNDTDEWDTKPLAKLHRMDSTTLPSNYSVNAAVQDPFYDPSYNKEFTLRSLTELNNKHPGWQTIEVDPVNGWYPTSQFDVYVDLDQVPKSDLQEKTAEEIIASLFYELADIHQVLRAIVYSYSFTQVVKIASGSAIMERINSAPIITPPIELPPVISATYDPFYQTMTVVGDVGLEVATYDPSNNVIGTGIIGAGGTVTYDIEEGMLEGGTAITTKSSTSNSVGHSLVASFVISNAGGTHYPYFYVSRNLHLNWINDASEVQEFQAGATGEMLVEYSTGESAILDIADHIGGSYIGMGKTGVQLDAATLRTAHQRPNSTFAQVKVRFRNLNTPVYLQVCQATDVYKFFDNAESEIGYQLICRDVPDYVSLSTVPSRLPPTVTRLNAMFWGDTDDTTPIVTDANVLAPLVNWNVSNVTSMITTFGYGATYNSLPITNWTPTSLKWLIDTFSYSDFDVPLNWTTPMLISTECAFLDNPHFNSNINLTMTNVTTVDSMFSGAASFNKPIEHLDTSSVTNFNFWMYQCSSFNQPVNGLNTSSATTMSYMFGFCTVLNQPMSNFDTSNLVNVNYTTGLHGFLTNASNFDQDLSGWCVPNITALPLNFNSSGILSPAHFPVWGTCPAP